MMGSKIQPDPFPPTMRTKETVLTSTSGVSNKIDLTDPWTTGVMNEVAPVDTCGEDTLKMGASMTS